MPPKKVVDISKAAPGVPKPTPGDEGTLAKDLVNIEDLNLPKSIVTRLAKGVLPPNTQIQGNAMLALTKSATVFINYLATHANDTAIGDNRKTVAPRDVFQALKDLEFPDWQERLQSELDKYTEIQNNKRDNYKKKVADKAEATGVVQAGDDGNDGLGEGQNQWIGDGQPLSKKARLDPEVSGMDTSEMQEGDHMGDHTADEDVEDDDNAPDDVDDDDEDPDNEERLEAEEQLEEEQREAEDEALDNGEDSD